MSAQWKEFWRNAEIMDPHEFLEAYETEIGRRIGLAHFQLKDTPGSHLAATTLKEFMAGKYSNDIILKASMDLESSTNSERSFRLRDLTNVVKETSAIRQNVAKLNDRISRLLQVLGSTPEAPFVGDVRLKNGAAYGEIFALEKLMMQLEEAVKDYYGPDLGGPQPLSTKVLGRPLDNFAEAIGVLWTKSGRDLQRADGAAFGELIAALHDQILGNNELYEQDDKLNKLVRSTRDRLRPKKDRT